MSSHTSTTETFESFDAGEHIRDELDARALLEVALEESADDPAALPTALGILARGGNMSELAKDVGMSRDGLYTALSETGNPTWSTLVKVTEALGLEIKVVQRTNASGKSARRQKASKVRRERQKRNSRTFRTLT